MATYQLYYFGVTGWGAVPRLTLALAGANWENKTPKEWAQEKDSAPFGQIPILIIKENGKETMLAQSASIIRYIERKFGLGPTDEIQAAIYDSIRESINEIFRALFLIVYGLKDKPEQQETAKADMVAKTGPAFIKYHSRLLAKNGSKGIYIEDKIGPVELQLYFMLCCIPKMAPGVFTRENAPELFKVHDAVLNNDRIKAYLASEKNIVS